MEQLSQGAYVLAPLAVRWKLLIPDLTERCVYVSMLLDQLGTMSPVGLVQILSNFIDLSVVSAGLKNVLVLLFTVDLLESLIKRAANMNDFSRAIHGHAGLLGRVDTLLFASILFALYNIHAQLLD
ncbi:hypothetical protein DYB25_003517 [Aphanomyces astaci]|uniref:Uncharacterized protein n=1 Tax=Aphanomyces astaci TaxID=112090 RepID=A0A397B610_APHAT|nr:hypothetical protein DYB25_003517 [Aphanomyces astaci]